MIDHSKFVFVAIESPRAIATYRTTRPASQRPGWRTGIARISSGGAAEAAPPEATSESRGVELGLGDGTGLHAPFDQDLAVRAVLHQVLEGRDQRLRHPVVLGERDPVRREGERLACQLELPVRLLDDVGGDLRVEEADLLPAARDR